MNELDKWTRRKSKRAPNCHIVCPIFYESVSYQQQLGKRQEGREKRTTGGAELEAEEGRGKRRITK